MAYVKSVDELSNLSKLKKHKAEYPENVFQAEKIKGLKNPKVTMYFTPLRLRFYFVFECEKKAPNFDDIQQLVRDHFEEEGVDKIFTESLEEFKEWVTEEIEETSFEGKFISEFHTSQGQSYEVYKSNQMEDTFLKQYNYPYQTYLHLDIDNASVIEEDIYWDYYVLLDTSLGYQRVAGFATIYKSLQNLTRFRVRISQVIILPEYQKKGLASSLYSIIYQKFLEKAECFEVTMESPTSVMSKIQNTFLLQRLLKLGMLNKLLNSSKSDFIKITKKNLNKVMNLSEADKEAMSQTVKCDKIKISRIYEFLVCMLIDSKDVDTF